jgi:hypothetical protein
MMTRGRSTRFASLSRSYMGKYEVTQAQWKAVMGTTVRQQRDKAGMPWHLKGEGPEHPIYYVSWEEAVEFCKRLGRRFRLPTEAEWEYACRAGSQTRFYYGDDPNYSQLDQYVWYSGNSDNQTHPVGKKKPNALGLHDMHGNVSEWCFDRYAAGINNYENAGTVDPTGPTSGYLARVRRGGSCLEDPESCRSADRNAGAAQGGRTDFIGFRVVFTGKTKGSQEVLEIALPEETATVSTASDEESESRPQTIVGVVRDEAGQPTDEADILIRPTRGWGLRKYAGGSFEISRRPSDPNTPMQEYHLIAQNKERNLAVGVQIEEDANALDVKLKTGVILTGRVVGSDGKQIEGARVTVGQLQTSDWSGRYLNWVESDAEGRFEIRTLPQGYDYDLRASCLHYRVAYAKVHSEDVRDNRIDGVSIVLPRGQFSISGVVVDANGKPVADAWIWCSGEDQIGINSRTDADGRFKANGIFAGKVDVMASVLGDDGQWAGGSVIVEAGATDVKVVLGTGDWITPPKGRACFPAETGVWVNGAVVPISQVGREQTIGGLTQAAPTVHFGHVARIEEHQGVFECRDILLDSGNRISVVDAHCFMLDSGNWIAAQDLRDGLRLKTIDGTVAIKSVTTRTTPYVGKVYNLKSATQDGIWWEKMA